MYLYYIGPYFTFYAATSDKLKSTGWSDPNHDNSETGGKYLYTPPPQLNFFRNGPPQSGAQKIVTLTPNIVPHPRK